MARARTSYAEMVFGNTFNIKSLIESTPPGAHLRDANAARDYARRDRRENASPRGRSAPLQSGARRARAGACHALPSVTTSGEFGPDVAFWRRPASPSYAAVLDDFLRLDAGPEQWDDPAFAPILANFKRRFMETNTEEGAVMETVLAYAMDQAYTSPRRALSPNSATTNTCGG